MGVFCVIEREFLVVGSFEIVFCYVDLSVRESG